MTPIIEELVEHASAAVKRFEELKVQYTDIVQEVNKVCYAKQELCGQLRQATADKDDALDALRAHIESERREVAE